MIKTAEKHQTLSIIFKKSITTSKQKTLAHTPRNHKPMGLKWLQPDHVNPTTQMHIQIDPSLNKRKEA
jgi:hypothetical protein